jgi:hypothetical protein
LFVDAAMQVRMTFDCHANDRNAEQDCRERVPVFVIDGPFKVIVQELLVTAHNYAEGWSPEFGRLSKAPGSRRGPFSFVPRLSATSGFATDRKILVSRLKSGAAASKGEKVC